MSARWNPHGFTPHKTIDAALPAPSYSASSHACKRHTGLDEGWGSGRLNDIYVRFPTVYNIVEPSSALRICQTCKRINVVKLFRERTCFSVEYASMCPQFGHCSDTWIFFLFISYVGIGTVVYSLTIILVSAFSCIFVCVFRFCLRAEGNASGCDLVTISIP